MRNEEAIMLTMKDDVSVPICLSGRLQKIDQDFCMDGTAYLLTTPLGGHRVKPTNEEAAEALENAAGTKMIIGVCGDLRHNVECVYLAVYWAGHPDRLQAIA
jgi:hypothetical protein